MAYVLGFFAADGNMIKNNRDAHFINFEITDKDLLEEIQKVLGSNHKITRRIRNENQKPAYRLQIGSKTIFEDLIKSGLTPRKSKVIKFPRVPEKYLSHFIRGYFDGDGSVTVGNYARKDRGNKKHKVILSGFTCGSQDFLKEIHEKLKKFSEIRGGTLYHHDGAYRLYFSTSDSLALYKFIYDKASAKLFLSRKREKFESYFGVAQTQ